MLGLARDEDGNAAIEFAIVAPVFIFLMAGMVFYGIYFGVVHSVQQISAEAARAAIAGVTDQERVSLAEAKATTDIAANPLLDPAAATVAVAQSAGNLSVTIRYDTSSMPMWAFQGLLPLPAKVVERVGVIDTGG